MWNRVEEDVTKKTAQSEGEQDVSKALSTLLIAHEKHVHEVYQKDGHNRDESGRNEGLCQERKRPHVCVNRVKSIVGVGHFNQPTHESFVDV